MIGGKWKRAGGIVSGMSPRTMLYLWAMLFSPISLWAPVVFGTLTYTLVTRFRSNNR